MHPIQQHILEQLILHGERRYSQLKPGEVEGNLFMYHLRQLLNQELVVKVSEHYELTDEGKRYADRLSLSTLQPRLQPKIVTMLVCTDKNGNYLLYKRKRQPFRGLVGFPYGKLHLEENLQVAAQRELREKTGLTAKLTHAGDLYLTILEKEEVASKMLCHVFTGNNPVGELKKETEIGEAFWLAESDFPKEQIMPGFLEIYRLVKDSPSRFFAEISAVGPLA